MSKRSSLLPPYLAHNPAWQQLVEAIDEVFDTEVDTPTDLLARLRDNWLLQTTSVDAITSRAVLDSSTAFYATERETLIRQANMLGFQFKQSDILSDDDYRLLVRNLGTYWFSKGTPAFIDFLAFCLNSTLSVVKLWSNQGPSYEQYGDLLEEGDPGVGTPNDKGGEWFETSHVNLFADPFKFPSTVDSISKLVALFNTLANYDLVLNAVMFETIQWIHTQGDDIAVCVKAFPMIDIEALIDSATLVVNSGQQFSMPENSPTSTVIGTVLATDYNGTIVDFRFSDTGTQTSPDGYVQITSGGVLTLTAAGAVSPMNDYETAPNYFEYRIEAQDNDGNWTAPGRVVVLTQDVDDEAPVVQDGQSFDYNENQLEGVPIGTVIATDNVGVTVFQFSATGTSTSSDGFYQIDNSGVVSLTATGVTSAANDQDVLPNTFTHSVQALDAAGNVSVAKPVTFNVLQVDEAAPVVTSGQTISYAENQLANAVLGTVAATDDIGVTGFRFTSTGTQTSDDGYFQIDNSGVITITASGAAVGSPANDFEVLPNVFSHQVEATDAVGHWSVGVAVTFSVTNVENTTAGLGYNLGFHLGGI